MRNRLLQFILSIAALTVGIGNLAAQQTEESLRAGDRIDIKISGVPQQDVVEISGTYTVSGEGKISLAHLKSEIQASGRRPSVLAKNIESAYIAAQIYTAPRIVINLDAGAAIRFVSVAGEVKGTGDVPYRADLTLLSAISSRGGFTDFADTKKVRLIRGNKTTMHDMIIVDKPDNAEVRDVFIIFSINTKGNIADVVL